MNSSFLAEQVDRIATHDGIVGCALVEAEAGLVWHASGSLTESDQVWEAAVDYWRLHHRQREHFANLGALHAAVMYHDQGVLTIFPCCDEPQVLLVALGVHRGVDWNQWHQRARRLGRVIRDNL